MGLTPPGLWITIDGPAGTGKSTTAALVTELFTAAGHQVHHTQQPSRGTFGAYVRQAIATLDGYPLACIITADRYQHVHGEILPALASGKTVICDRYVASAALDILRGVPAEIVWQMHAALPPPTLAILLTTSDQRAQARIAERGAHSRWQHHPDNTRRERHAYAEAAEHLREAGWPLLTIDTTTTPPRNVAEMITSAAHPSDRCPTGGAVGPVHDSE